MGWVADNKGAGVWEFTEQGDKRGYINNPRWADDPAHDDRHKPCGYWPRSQATIESTDLTCTQTPIDDWPCGNANEGIACDSDRIYVLDDKTGESGWYTYLNDGTFDYQKVTTSNWPNGIAVDDSYLYLGFTATGAGALVARIERYDKSDGTFLAYWKIGSTTFGQNPQGMVRYGSHLYVTSVWGLHKYSIPSGTLVWEVNVRGAGAGEFWTAYALDVSPDHVYVTDYSYAKVVKYTVSDGSFVSEHTNMIPSSPRGLSILGEYVFMTAASNIYVFDLDMNYICTATGVNSKGPVCNDSTYFYGVRDTGATPYGAYKVTVAVKEASETITIVPISEIDPVWTMPD